MTLARLDLPKRVARTLLAAGIQNEDDLCLRSPHDLLRIRSIGRKSLRQIKEALAARSRCLAENVAVSSSVPFKERAERFLSGLVALTRRTGLALSAHGETLAPVDVTAWEIAYALKADTNGVLTIDWGVNGPATPSGAPNAAA